MKKLVSVLLAVLMLLSITGCGKSADHGTTDFSGGSTTQQEKPTTLTRGHYRSIACGDVHTVALKNDGTVVATGRNAFGQCDVSDWKNIVSVDAGAGYTLGLKENGTVVGAGWSKIGQCDVSGWKNIVEISCGGAFSLGLKKDGTVVSTIDTEKYDPYDLVGDGYTEDDARQEKEVLEWVKRQVDSWTDIVAIAAGGMHAVGLKSDGTVVAAGSTNGSQSDVGDWQNMIAIDANNSSGVDFGLTIGVTSQGTIRYNETYSGYDDGWSDWMSDWKNLKAVAIGEGCIAALTENGTVNAIDTMTSEWHTKYQSGRADDGVEDWLGIVAVDVGTCHTVGLRYDGTVVAAGFNEFGQCDVSGWTDIRVYE